MFAKQGTKHDDEKAHDTEQAVTPQKKESNITLNFTSNDNLGKVQTQIGKNSMMMTDVMRTDSDL